MRIISHRGNLEGSNSSTENSIESVKKAIELGFDVEIDIWFKDDQFFLGHDIPEYEVDINFLFEFKNKLWIHCKNLDCFQKLLQTEFNFFWHDRDLTTFTSKLIPWSQPGVFIESGITVCINYEKLPKIYGVCTDEPIKFKLNHVKF